MPYVDVPAGRIEYHQEGEGPDVVLLHGLLMDHTLWDRVLPLLPAGFRYTRPVLPLGAHRVPMRPDADLSLGGLTHLVADVLDALEVEDATLVHADWGGGLFLTAAGRDARVGSLVVLPSEAWENFPPGLPGRMAALAARLPGGLRLAARQLRVGWLRRSPLLFGQMVKHPLPDDLVRGWTAPLLADRRVEDDVRRYGRSGFDRDRLRRDTDALAGFAGPALVLWSPENRVMPPEHGARLAALLPEGRLVEVPDAYVLSMWDAPEAVAREMGAFLRQVHPTEPTQAPAGTS